MPSYMNRSLISTDKGKSIYNLTYNAYSNICGKHGVTGIPKMKDVRFIPAEEPKFPMFARPCPRKPCHGFVDSRVVRTPHALLNLYRESLREDKDGEIVMMKAYSASLSAVGTNSGVTWGRGTDAVTSGKGQETVTIQAPSQMAGIKSLLERCAPVICST